jgi:predicted nuclease of predicted toxin-antitoxin system
VRRLLLDANLSPKTAAFLAHTFAYDVVDLKTLGLEHLSDPQVVDFAITESRTIVSFDVDFGRLYYRYQRGQIGIIVLRLRLQSSTAVHRVLRRFFADPATDSIPIERSLVLIDDFRVRVIDKAIELSGEVDL